MTPDKGRFGAGAAASMRRIARRLLLLSALIYGGLCAVLYAAQDSLLYFPTPIPRGATAETTMRLAVSGAELNVAVRPHPGPAALIYFGGNAEDVFLTLPYFSEAFPEHALFLLHYRGYGGSSGAPSEQALHDDALALFDRVRESHPNIVVLGRSLGSGVALRLAHRRPARRLILITPYDSLVEVAAAHYPAFPIRWLMRDHYDSGRHAPEITTPTLILAAERDEVIPAASTERLRARFADGVATHVVLPGTGHNTISHNDEYFATIRSAL